jgi:hypothetical protein
MHLITTDAPEPDSRGLDHAMSQQRALLRMSPLHVLMDPRVIGERGDAVLRTAMPGGDSGVGGESLERTDAVLKELANAGTQFCVPCVLVYVRHALLNRGRRRSRRWMTEQGAAADNACRDGAPGGVGLFAGARAPRDPHHPSRLGSRKLGVQVGRSQCRPGRSRKPPGASRRSIPLLWRGNGKQGDGPAPGPEKPRHGTAELCQWTTVPALSCGSQRRDRCTKPAAMAL